jgi:hypothetical protein
MKPKHLSALVCCLCLLLFLTTGCHKELPPHIKDFGPQKVKAGEVFNVQPGGLSAMWIKADNVTDTTTIVWGKIQVNTFKEPYGVSALIPKELYASSGPVQIHLLDTKTGAKSNIVVLDIK